MVLWPGHGIGDDDSYQVLEQEFMKASEYDELLRDPSDFAIRKFLPRMFSELEGLAMLPPVSLSLGGFFGFLQGAMIFTLPPVVKALRALESAGASNARWISHLMECSARLEKLGFPGIPFYNGATIWPPFDFIGNSLRGMKGIFLDMRRCPEKTARRRRAHHRRFYRTLGAGFARQKRELRAYRHQSRVRRIYFLEGLRAFLLAAVEDDYLLFD
jgi:hypothetical protein